MLRRAPIVVVLVTTLFFSSALVAAPRSVSLGPISGLAALNATLLLGCGLALLLNWTRVVPLPSGSRWLVAFCAFDVISFLWTPLTAESLQDALVWLATLGFFSLGVVLASYGEQSWGVVRRALFAALPVVSVVAGAQLVGGMESASTPLVLGVYCCFFLGIWTARNHVRYLAVAGLLIVLMLLLVARTPAAASLAIAGLAILGFPRLSTGVKLSLTVLLPVAALLGLLGALALLPSLFASMFSGDAGVSIGGFTINTSGRAFWWVVVIDSALQSPWIGHGTDIAASMVTEEKWRHPHNDYLRLFHHAGLVGLSFWILGWSRIAAGIRRAKRVGLVGTSAREARSTALNAIVFVALVMVTDNVIVYSFVMFPVALLVGVASGTSTWKGNSTVREIPA